MGEVGGEVNRWCTWQDGLCDSEAVANVSPTMFAMHAQASIAAEMQRRRVRPSPPNLAPRPYTSNLVLFPRKVVLPRCVATSIPLNQPPPRRRPIHFLNRKHMTSKR